MKTVILAGGFGTRFSEETHKIPKPMIKINNKPILFHIMNIYRKYGYNEFCLALGYKAELVNNYLLNNGFKKMFFCNLICILANSASRGWYDEILVFPFF